MKDKHRVLIVAAEPSSAMYAERLLAEWKSEGLNIEAFGIGDKAMEEQGFEVLGRTEDLAVMGLQEIISHWPVIKKAFYKLVDSIKEKKPDLILLMDYPEFNLRFAKKVKDFGVPVYYYISPQIWAWRTGRVHKIKKLIDKMLVIFPFEEDFYKKHNVSCEFVGHPLLDFLDTKIPNDQQTQKLRGKYNINHTDHVLGLMPGSRKKELKFNLEVQVKTAEKITKKHSYVKPVLLLAPGLDYEAVKLQAQEYGFTGEYMQEKPFAMIAASDTVLCASGTATLMVGLCEKPMAVMYKMNALSAFVAKKLVKHVANFAMINLVFRREIVKEFFQEDANLENLYKEVEELITNHASKRTLMLESLKTLPEKLGRRGGIKKLSNAVWQRLQGSV